MFKGGVEGEGRGCAGGGEGGNCAGAEGSCNGERGKCSGRVGSCTTGGDCSCFGGDFISTGAEGSFTAGVIGSDGIDAVGFGLVGTVYVHLSSILVLSILSILLKAYIHCVYSLFTILSIHSPPILTIPLSSRRGVSLLFQ